MCRLLRFPITLVAISYLALSAIPLLPLAFNRATDNLAGTFVLELLAWLAVWALFKRPARFHWLLLPAFLALPVELYLHSFYNQSISPHHLGIILETSPSEVREFLGYKVFLLAGAVLAVLAWFVLSWQAAARTNALDWNGNSRWFVIFLLACALALFVFERQGTDTKSAVPPKTQVSLGSITASHSDKTENTLFLGISSWARLTWDITTFGKTWPFGLVVRGHEFWLERRYLAELTHKSAQFKFGAQHVSTIDIPQVIVMVIGESARYDRWSLNGYDRDTNPLLKREKNLVSLSNVVTAVSATRLSVPVLVSRKPATESLRAGFSEKSFLSAFREAGFKTYWLSNQMSFGQFDTPVSVFAKEADVAHFLNLGGLTSGASYDEALLEPFKTALSDPSKKKLIVLHTLGSHWNYSHRYPKEYDKWQPSLFDVAAPAYTDRAIKNQLNNSYDNSVLYTDWFLAQLIGALKSSAQVTAMMYVSDHGQTLYDGSCKLAFHGHNTQYEFHVPALVWYSDLYRLAHPRKVARLIKNKDAKLATENVFHALLDMADIRYQTEQLEWSFLSQQFRLHKRYVDSYGWTDYDNATIRGDCREVIDKGTPLVQRK